MNPKRFDLALERIQPAQWKRFEEFASAFLSSDFPNLRTMAAPSGDRGRDAELFSTKDDPSVLLQYSVTADWNDKIKKTVTKIKQEFPEVSLLVYATNQVIGANADELKKSLRKNENIFLDIRDRGWFVERLDFSQQTQITAEKLAQDIVDPYLASAAVIDKKAIALTSGEAQAAFIYLGLQWEDDNREKGLTKLCFDGLVRAVLRETHSDNRYTRDEVRRRIRLVLPNHPPEKVDTFTDLALTRLTKKVVRHWSALDEFCLMHDERLRLRDRLVLYESADNDFQRGLTDISKQVALRHKLTLTPEQSINLLERIRRVLEKFLFSRGEAFATAVRTGDFLQMGFDQLKELVIRDIGEHSDSLRIGARLTDLTVDVIKKIIELPSEATQHYLRFLSDAYTLLAFLRETPDVQSVITKMFADGDIWLDTSIILPLLAEDLVEPENRQFSHLLHAANEAGLNLYITEGVLEEVERHTNRCLACYRTPSRDWVGNLPFLYSVYLLTGRPVNGFNNWIERFRGDSRPEDDIADYLQQIYGISIKSLEAEVDNAPTELRTAIQEVWNEIHERRRRYLPDADAMTTQRLAAHDLENYLGVIERRREERESPFGYNSWWLTLDSDAFQVKARLREFISSKIPHSPVLSPDFMTNYLAFGPVRRQVSKVREMGLPVVLDVSVTEYLPPELVSLAEKVRVEMQGSPELLIRRKVRDRLDAAKMRKGELVERGLKGVHEGLRDKITGRLRTPETS